MTLRRCSLFGAVGATVLASAPVRSDPGEGVWVTGEVPAAVAVSSPQDSDFRAGAMPSLAAFLPFASHAAVGLRMRAGVLADAHAQPATGVAPVGTGGLVTAALALRFDAAASWIELDAGGGVTGRDPVPAWEVGVGHDFAIGSYAIGPTLRYLRVAGGGADRMIDRGPAAIVLVGLELRTGVPRRPHVAEQIVAAAPPPPPPVVDHDPIALVEHSCVGDVDPADGCPPPDRDHDGIPDAIDQCPDDPETVNGVEDADGCPDQGLIEVVNDRIVLEERVLFDFDRARVKHAARPVLAAIVTAWQAHPEWGQMVVEGHADPRGTADYNAQLSERRANNVRRALVAAGLPADRIQSVGFGASHPVDPGKTEAAYQRNRRVEFVITHEGGVR